MRTGFGKFILNQGAKSIISNPNPDATLYLVAFRGVKRSFWPGLP